MQQREIDHLARQIQQATVGSQRFLDARGITGRLAKRILERSVALMREDSADLRRDGAA